MRKPGSRIEPLAYSRLRLSQAAPTSNQLQSLEARVAVLADDDVIVHADAERSGDRDGLADASRDRLKRDEFSLNRFGIPKSADF